MRLLLVILGLFLLSVQTNAQYSAVGSSWKLDLGIMPGSATNGGYGFVLGGDARLQTKVAPKTIFTLTTGVTQFFGRTGIHGMGYIPVKPGAKYFLGENLYAGLEMGIGFGLVEGSGRSFIWAPAIGLNFRKVEISAKNEDAPGFTFSNGINNSSLKQFAVRVAFGFNVQ